MTLIRDLIHIPKEIYQGDFVLQLSSGIEQASTLADYVVTEQLCRQFVNALGFVQSGIEGGQSKAAFIHGSFGSGKSHFMAVLYRLLAGDPQAWQHDDLSGSIAKFSPLRQRKLLLLDFHMIDAVSMESAILGGYVKKVSKLHPEAPLPQVYKTDQLLNDASNLVQDEAGTRLVLDKLNSEVAQQDDGWGELASRAWDEPRLRQALQAPPGNQDRNELVHLLTRTVYKSYVDQHSNITESFLPFEEGLLRLTHHTKQLGYDGLVLFLDELVLWLASKAADLRFVQTEIQKIVKLIESGSSTRAVPILSFVARQRDLREMMGDAPSGLEQFNFQDAVKHWQGRFHVIELEDNNLPEIVSRRILRPRNPESKAQLEQALDSLNLNEEVRTTLQTANYDWEAFRKLYPFSPALVDTLVAVSAVLQRQRTAIRILMELLVDNRNTLELGQLIPVGDLYDYVSRKFEPYADSMLRAYEAAERLLSEKFLPLLCEQYEIPNVPPYPSGVQNDLRLVKTLILAALVPGVEALRSIDPSKLVALNHGMIRTPFAGQEKKAVLGKLQKWQGQIGELRVDEETRRVSLKLSNVDTDRILEQVRGEDSFGNRKRRLRQMLFRALGLKEEAQGMLTSEVQVLWRGTLRTFEVIYTNVREKSLSDLKTDPSRPRLILDYPLDEDNFFPSDDVERLKEFRKSMDEDTRTTVWLPRFLSRRTLKDLGSLIQIEYVLTGDRLRDHTPHLSLVDREQAKLSLGNLSVALTRRLTEALEMAYGVRKVEPGVLDEGDRNQLQEHEMFQSLHTNFQPRVPGAADMEGALRDLLTQELTAQFPRHPEFPVDRDITVGQIKLVWKDIQRAIVDPSHRIDIPDKPQRERMAQIAQTLGFGLMGETHFAFKPDWLSPLQQSYHLAGSPEPLRAWDLFQWLDQPEPRGLTNRIRSLLVFAFAEQTQRQLFRHDVLITDYEPDLDPDTQLRLQELPTPEEWEGALVRCRLLYHDLGPLQLNAPNVQLLDREFLSRIHTLNLPLSQLPQLLVSLAADLGEKSDTSPRIATARFGRQWSELAQAKLSPLERIRKIAQLPLGALPANLQTHFQSSALNYDVLKSDYRVSLITVSHLVSGGRESGQEILRPLKEAMLQEEYARPLAPPMQNFLKHAPDWVKRNLPQPTTQPAISPPPAAEPESRNLSSLASVTLTKATAGQTRDRLRELEDLLKEHPEAEVDLSWKVWQRS